MSMSGVINVDKHVDEWSLNSNDLKKVLDCEGQSKYHNITQYITGKHTVGRELNFLFLSCIVLDKHVC